MLLKKYIIHCEIFCKNSLAKGILPDDLKIARITPTLKLREITEASNYRPMSLLPCFLRFSLEKVMYNRLLTYLIGNNIS